MQLFAAICTFLSVTSFVNTENDPYNDNFDTGYPHGPDHGSEKRSENYQAEGSYAPAEPSYSHDPDPYETPAHADPYGTDKGHKQDPYSSSDHHKPDPYKPAPSYKAPEPEPHYKASQGTYDPYSAPIDHQTYGRAPATGHAKDTSYKTQQSGYDSHAYGSNSGFAAKHHKNSHQTGYHDPYASQHKPHKSSGSATGSSHSHGFSHDPYGKHAQKSSGYPSSNHLKGFSGTIHGYVPSYSYGNSYHQDEHDCFRTYKNCIIINAQPYERRSGVTLEDCKHLCLDDSGDDHFICQSFVFDHKHNICDLFAHTGNQYPAKLVSFYGRDYFEKTTYECKTTKTSKAAQTTTAAVDATTTGPITTTGPLFSDSCPTGQASRFSQIDNMILEGSDDIPIGQVSLDECVRQCQGRWDCLSFDYRDRNCILSRTAASPDGSGQLRTGINNAAYFERLCVPANSAANCDVTFDRVPQMILLGFADSVLTTRSFRECYRQCIEAQSTLGFSCESAAYYYQEAQQNCIILSENRQSQPDLFLAEPIERVDYFEPGCAPTFQRSFKLSSNGRQSRFSDRFVASLGRAVLAPVETEESIESSLQIEPPSLDPQINYNPISDGWMEWSPCDRLSNGRRFRFQICSATKLTDCPVETTWCNSEGDRLGVLKEHLISNATVSTLLQLRGEKLQACPEDKCCPVFEGCRIGIEYSSVDKKAAWCTNPCNE